MSYHLSSLYHLLLENLSSYLISSRKWSYNHQTQEWIVQTSHLPSLSTFVRIKDSLHRFSWQSKNLHHVHPLSHLKSLLQYLPELLYLKYLRIHPLQRPWSSVWQAVVSSAFEPSESPVQKVRSVYALSSPVYGERVRMNVCNLLYDLYHPYKLLSWRIRYLQKGPATHVIPHLYPQRRLHF